MNIQDRLKIFFARLAAAPPAKDSAGALLLICRTLEEVENEFCPVIEQRPPPQTFDGRMYLPQPDNMYTSDNQTVWVKTRKHRIAINPNGAFVVFQQMPGRTLVRVFEKTGGSR